MRKIYLEIIHEGATGVSDNSGENAKGENLALLAQMEMINQLTLFPEMLEMLKTIKDIAQDNMPKSSAYLRHDSNLYNQDKVDIYELCKSISEKCHIAINKAEGGK
tara:strand:- start:43 stop:360 length:318 start_codon:yes stop_codon:yes gene_type:complete